MCFVIVLCLSVGFLSFRGLGVFFDLDICCGGYCGLNVDFLRVLFWRWFWL